MLRERTTFTRAIRAATATLPGCRKTLLTQQQQQVSFSTTTTPSDAVAVQLDYYMSHQFAGVAWALVNDSYVKKGLDVSFLPTCPVGQEQRRVRDHQNNGGSTGLTTVGSVEQNIFVPTLHASPDLKVSAVAAMFHQSPLCLASLAHPIEGGSDAIGAHADTVTLLRRLFPDRNVVASPRGTKNGDLLSGKVGAIQAYTTTEVPALRHTLGSNDPVVVTPLEGLDGAKLGYSQALFAPDECLSDDRLEVVRSFLDATFSGWNEALRNPEETLEVVREAQKMLGLDDESNDHWFPSAVFEKEMLAACQLHVKGTFEGDRYGVIDPARWNAATSWLLEGNDGGTTSLPGKEDFGLDAKVWRPPANLLPGNKLARDTLETVKSSAEAFAETHNGRRPSLAVVTVGDLPRYHHGERRLDLYSDPSRSWFSKTSAGDANGIDVSEVRLPSSTTTHELLDEIYKLQGEENGVDGIQLMYPLPAHIDSHTVYGAIPPSADVDGIHFEGQRGIGNENAYAPVTPVATVTMLDHFDVPLENKRVLVIGRSPIVGSPLAHMLREKGGVVTVAHSRTSPKMLEELVGEADVIVCGAGKPGVVKAEWIKKDDAVVMNVGTTYDEEQEKLVSDVEGDLGDLRHSPVPGGIGPLSLAVLFQNVVKAAWDNGNGASEEQTA